jgi:hypothetical protein
MSGDLLYPGAVVPGKDLVVPTEQQAVWASEQYSSRRLGESNNVLHPPEFEPLFVSRPNFRLLKTHYPGSTYVVYAIQVCYRHCLQCRFMIVLRQEFLEEIMKGHVFIC